MPYLVQLIPFWALPIAFDASTMWRIAGRHLRVICLPRADRFLDNAHRITAEWS